MRRWLITAGILTVLAVAGIVTFVTIGQWLVVQDPLVHADVIVILSGHLPDRALEAAQMYRAGYAEQVWISQPISPTAELKTMNIYFLGEDFYNEKVLLARGVPADVIEILEHPSANTEEEVREISETMRRNNFHSVIVVTSKAHTRRVRTIWHKLVGSDPRAIVRFAEDDPYDGAHWWHHTQDALDIVREILGLLNAWGGFPLRPSRS
ncbi:MAG: YdcF family protein [Acidobacteriia bacterium]|nr:YdcF family protein [Terriglobia bacterium]